jgi:pimeloyl-ACP methyl ester carboxylesterase
LLKILLSRPAADWERELLAAGVGCVVAEDRTMEQTYQGHRRLVPGQGALPGRRRAVTWRRGDDMQILAAGPTERRLVLDGIELAADEYPAGKDPKGTALFLHGGGQTRHSWKGAAAALAASGWHALSLDARGHGDSGWAPDGDYSMEALVDDLTQVAGEYDHPVLIGASMGGLTSLIAVGEGEVTARALVLVDVAPRIEKRGADRIAAFMRARPEGFESLEAVAEAVAAYNPHRARPPRPEGLRKNVRLREDGRWHWHWDPAFIQPADGEPGRLTDPERLRDAARAVRVPALLVRGARSDVLSEEGTKEFLQLVPEARFVDVKGAGHMVAGDDNDIFAREVRRFLGTL